MEKNWVIYKNRLNLSVQGCGHGRHLDGITTKPIELTVTQTSANRGLTDEENWRKLLCTKMT
jgi:hypothetical protein